MTTFVVRVWLPDRPGALGQVASRIGAVRGDVVGIDILERGAGRAIDELHVTLPDETLVDLLVAEIAQVDGVDVEDVRPAAGPVHDARADALETAARLVEADDPMTVLKMLCEDATSEFDADWGVVLDVAGERLAAVVGDPPAPGWLVAFVVGARHAAVGGGATVDDLAWATLPGTELELVLGRRGRPFRERERRQLHALGRIAGALVRRHG